MNQDRPLNQNDAEAVDNLINKLEKKVSKEQKHVTYKDCEIIPYERNPLIGKNFSFNQCRVSNFFKCFSSKANVFQQIL